MANEFSITASVNLTNGNNKYAKSASFRATQTTNNGPAVGSLTISTSGTTVSLAQLTAPGITHLTNIDLTNYVTWGLYISSTFYPVGEVLAGESFPVRLARDLLTANTAAAVLRMKANTANVIMQIDAFDK